MSYLEYRVWSIEYRERLEGYEERGSAKVQIGAELLCKSGFLTSWPVDKLTSGQGRPRVNSRGLKKIQLCRDAVPTLPITAAGNRSRLPMAERLTSERPMPRWPSPVTRENNDRDILSGFRSPFECCFCLSLLHLCTSRRRVALLHLGQHVVLSLPADSQRPPNCLTQDSRQRIPSNG